MTALTPRASLSITILTDEDYSILMGREGGVEAFGVFAALVLVARERLTQERARNIPGTDALVIDNSIAHACSLAKITQGQLNRCLALLDAVAHETDSSPWMYIGGDGKLVIRSFFKFNASKSDNWGGPRPGSGRPPKNPQIKRNHSDTARLPAVSDSTPASDAAPRPEPGERAELRVVDPSAVERVESLCNELFPCTSWPANARRACDLYPTAWVEEALQTARDRNAKDWRYITGILERFKQQGMSDSEQRAKRAPSQPRASPMQGQMERDRIAGEKWMAKLKQKEASNG